MRKSDDSRLRVRGSFIASTIVLATVLGLFVGYSFLLATPVGFRAYIVDVNKPGVTDCDAYDLVVTPQGAHQFHLDGGGKIDGAKLKAALDKELRYRAEKFILVEAAPGVSYGDFIEALDKVSGPGIRVGLVTSQVRQLAGNDGCLILRGVGDEKDRDRLPDSLIPDRLK